MSLGNWDHKCDMGVNLRSAHQHNPSMASIVTLLLCCCTSSLKFSSKVHTTTTYSITDATQWLLEHTITPGSCNQNTNKLKCPEPCWCHDNDAAIGQLYEAVISNVIFCVWRKNSKLSRSAWWRSGRSVWKTGRSSAKKTDVTLTTGRKRKRHSVSTRSSSRKVIHVCLHLDTETHEPVRHEEGGAGFHIHHIHGGSCCVNAGCSG